MKTIAVVLILGFLTWSVVPAVSAEDSKVSSATRQVESGAKKLGQGLEETAKGIGNTVVEGAKVTGEKLRESGKAAEPEAKTAWTNAKQGAVAFGYSVKNFFHRLLN